MAEPHTVNGGLIVPNTGDLVGTWGLLLLTQILLPLMGFCAAFRRSALRQLPSLSRLLPVLLRRPEAARLRPRTRFSSSPEYYDQCSVTLPLPGMMIIHNLTAGDAFVTDVFLCLAQGKP